VSGFDLERHKGTVDAVTPDGRSPANPREIALATTTLHQLGLHIGSQVRVNVTAIDGPARMFTVVGTAIIPSDDQTATIPGGAVITRAGLLRMAPDTTNIPPPSDAYVDFAPGTMTPAHLAVLQHQIGNEFSVFGAQPPTDVLNFGRVQNLPVLLAFLLAALAAATLVLTLISSAHRRRGDLAVLKALGYRPLQLRAVVACQSMAMAAIGLAVGVPLGVAVGRWLWLVVAEHLGTIPQTVIPGWELAAMAAGVLILALAAATWPGRMAARTPVATALHAI
jgi:FtsX-like permease family